MAEEAKERRRLGRVTMAYLKIANNFIPQRAKRKGEKREKRRESKQRERERKRERVRRADSERASNGREDLLHICQEILKVLLNYWRLLLLIGFINTSGVQLT